MKLVDLPLPGDCAVVAKNTRLDQSVCAVGMYHLDECSDVAAPPMHQSRSGGVALYEVYIDSWASPHDRPPEISLAQELHVPSGVFELKWHGLKLGAFCADGSLVVFDYRDPDVAGSSGASNSSSFSFIESVSFKAAGHHEDSDPSSELGLCFDWLSDTSVVCSYSSGVVRAFDIDKGGQCANQIDSAHGSVGYGSETWAIAVAPDHADLVLTGGDDGFLKGWDLRFNTANGAEQTATFSRKKEFSAGVTCIQFCPNHPHVFASGSYDEKLTLWDLRNTRQPFCDTQINCGGGVWRLNWLWSSSREAESPGLPLISTACMQGGVSVIEDGSVTYTYSGHNGLVYGADWCIGKPTSQHIPRCVFSVSFDSKQLHGFVLPKDELF